MENEISNALARDFAWTGSWCTFVDLGNGQGVKFYSTPEERDQAWVAQACAWEADAAPKAGDMLEMTNPATMPNPMHVTFEETIFGYYTEVVDTDQNLLDHDWQDLKKRLKAAGFHTGDSNACMNTGYRSDGVAVQFDFDPNFAMMDFWD